MRLPKSFRRDVLNIRIADADLVGLPIQVGVSRVSNGGPSDQTQAKNLVTLYRHDFRPALHRIDCYDSVWLRQGLAPRGVR